MTYQSTRNQNIEVTSASAITRGISEDGGLFVPSKLPAITWEELADWVDAPYVGRAAAILSKFLTDFAPDEVAECCRLAYGDRFHDPKIAPLHKLADGVHILELWHGPTCAFKDMALQILPHLMRVSAAKTGDGREIVILVATSGDTGKAALEGFKDAPGARILVFYPVDGVSPMQKLQMTTQEGGNVGVCAIRGNFDDAQTGVKKIFTDQEIARKLAAHGMMFSSANSINWGRLVPQIVYYVSAYCDLAAAGEIKMGDPVNAVVPTGNFGNILAAYYAKKMGLPLGRLICASNKNKVLTDFIETGTYDRNREFYATSSPSMDILISSNLERLLFDLADRDDETIRNWMASLNKTGKYTVTPAVHEQLKSMFAGGFCDENQNAAAIRDTFEKHRYLLDTHTAVGVRVYDEYRRRTGDETPTVIASTANPYKFSASVLKALGGDSAGWDEFEKVEALHRLTGCPVPPPLADLRGKTPRFTGICGQEEMAGVVYDLLGI